MSAICFEIKDQSIWVCQKVGYTDKKDVINPWIKEVHYFRTNPVG